MAKQQSAPSTVAVPPDLIDRKIYLIRGLKVIVDADLAELYRVETKMLNRAVQRNLDRFPADFMFQLTPEEAESLRYQSGTSNPGRGGRRYLPHVFTEHGVAMLSSVLHSPRAIQMNILIVRAFVKMRELLASHKDLADRVAMLEASQQQHASVINSLAGEIDELKQPLDIPAKSPMGYPVKGN